MSRISGYTSPLLCAVAAILISGCNASPSLTSSAVTTAAAGTATPVTSVPNPPSITQPSVYIDDDTHSLETVGVFPKSATGGPFTLSIPGILPSLDAAGNIYVYTGTDIAVYSKTAAGAAPVRLLHTGQNTGVAKVVDMMASQSGELYVLDGTGIAVFGPAASGNDKPTRYMIPPPATMVYVNFTLDNLGNLYLANQQDVISVFDATANGSVLPLRTIQTSGFSSRFLNLSMATDKAGNLYVLTLYYTGGENYASEYGVVEFSATATGKASAIGYFSAPDSYPWTCGDAVAVDSAGMVYVSSGSSGGTYGPCLLYEFAPDTSGKNTATATIPIAGWTDSIRTRMAVDF